MALNPPRMFDSAVPQPFPTETFILRRKGIRAVVRNSDLSFSEDGEIFVSTLRIVFLSSQVSNGVSGFDIPLANLSNEKFNQPIFGCNNLSFTLQPIGGGGLNYETNFKLEFREGGAGSFLHFFIKSLSAMRETLFSGRNLADHSQHPFSQTVANPSFANNAVFTDPDDPSVLYVARAPQGTQVVMPEAGYSTFYTK
eukprot:c19483_g1_i2.p1 GENE.c19483_g1_i2~~c19483_g1_i2.p1  ORF type:complete len:197 (-),score=63.11 c19483_g1_i2:127-717(-)